MYFGAPNHNNNVKCGNGAAPNCVVFVVNWLGNRQKIFIFSTV